METLSEKQREILVKSVAYNGGIIIDSRERPDIEKLESLGFVDVDRSMLPYVGEFVVHSSFAGRIFILGERMDKKTEGPIVQMGVATVDRSTIIELFDCSESNGVVLKPEENKQRFITLTRTHSRKAKSEENYFRTFPEMLTWVLQHTTFDKIKFDTEFVTRTEEDVVGLLQAVSFKNSVFECFQWEYKIKRIDDTDLSKGFMVWAEFQRPETHTGELGTGRGRDDIIQVGFTATRIFFILYTLTWFLVEHELREGMRFFGVRPLYPHNMIWDYMALSGKVP